MKDFDLWNNNKKKIEDLGENKFYHQRDIWWCSLGLNIGFEQDGKDKGFQRPVLIVKALGDKTCIVLPLTTSNKNHKYRVEIGEVQIGK
jgi:mRNA interferase MazF